MTVVVTGVAGFIGSTLAQRLLDRGERVVGIDSFTDYYDVSIKRANVAGLRAYPRFDLRETRLESVAESDLGDPRVIFHLAGQPGVRRSWGREFDAYTTSNIAATQNLLEVAARLPRLERIVNSSSSSVYGDAESFPTAETALPGPLSPYGVTKLAAEHLCGVYAADHGLAVTSLRYFTVYGPRQRPDMAFTRFLTAVRDGRPIEVYGSGNQVRDFTFVDDVVDANLAASEAGHQGHRAFNVAGGSSASVNDVLEEIARITGRVPDVRRLDPARGDVLRTGGDTSRIRDEVGWVPRTPLTDGLERQWAWVSAQ